MVNIKGYEFKEIKLSDSYNRKALQFKNKIINNLKIFGLTEEDTNIPLEKIAMRKAQATASWYLWGEHLFYSYNGSSKFVENLGMVFQVIQHFTTLLNEEKITQEEFLKTFAEDHDIIKQRKDARELIGVEEHSTDFDTMTKKYKKLSKEHHPDMPGGDTEKFQAINKAHKILKKELN